MSAPKTPAQQARALVERQRNADAQALGKALPHPNVWDSLDPTKIPAGASDQDYLQSCREFIKLCRPRARRQHVI